MSKKKVGYGEAIRFGFEYLMEKYPDVCLMGQGLWSPWYVGNSMTDLDKKFGKERVMDTPVSEQATTGAAIGAGLTGLRTVVIHPRMDFMVLATDAIVNQAAKWQHMFGGCSRPKVTIRGIINRGGEQGAQHSQALHAWYAHIPGLRVVMPATPKDARDLLIASVLCDDPVVYIDDRWLYEEEQEIGPVEELKLEDQGPQVIKSGEDITLVGSSFSTKLARLSAELLKDKGISAEVIDLRIINPLDCRTVFKSVKKTGRLLCVDSGWLNCGLGGEIIARVTEELPLNIWKAKPGRVALPHAPAPTSKHLEKAYYPCEQLVFEKAMKIMGHSSNSTVGTAGPALKTERASLVASE